VCDLLIDGSSGKIRINVINASGQKTFVDGSSSTNTGESMKYALLLLLLMMMMMMMMLFS